MPFVVGENVGPYRIIEKLGRGGMATVFKAYHAALDRYVAIKALHPAFMEDPNFLARFQREARVVAKLEHPNIVPIYDFAEHEGRPYLVMKFIEGDTLKARVVRDGVLKDQIIDIVEAVGAALTYAHGQGILHRDVKPSNVLLANNGRIYLADFGLARIAQAGESTLSGDMMLGTPQYISPEQAMGIGDLDAGTDIYSFGVMLYELTVGQVPFSADTPFSIIHDHIYTPLPLPRTINEKVPEEIERVLLKALAKERSDRFEDIAALVYAFSQAFAQADSGIIPGVQAVVEAQRTVAPFPPTIGEAIPGPGEGAISTASIPEAHEKQVPSVPTKKAKEKKPFFRRLRWWQIAIVAVGLVLCCLFTIGIISQRQKEQQQAAETTIPTVGVVDELPTKTPFESDGDDQMSIAKRMVEENPDDPQAYLELGIAFFDTGQSRAGEEAFKTAIDLSDGSADVYLKVLEILNEKELWLNAAQAYVEFFAEHPDQLEGGEIDNFHRAAYISSSFPVAEEYIPISDVKNIDPVFEQVLKARYILFNSSPERAQFVLDETFAEIPEVSEAALLQAEIYNSQGQLDAAREILEVMLKSEGLPFWMNEFIEEYIYIPAQTQAAETDDSVMSVDEARAKVEANPEDPWAYLELADALMAAGKFDEIEAQIQAAMEYSDDDPDVYMRAAEILAKHNIYLYTVDMYLAATRLPGGPSFEDVDGLIAEAMYVSSVGSDAINHLSAMESDLDPIMMEIAKIRNTLHIDDREVARFQLQNLREQYPDEPEVLLLEAEILYIFGDDEAAIKQWELLVEDESAPIWVRRQARIFLVKTNQ